MKKAKKIRPTAICGPLILLILHIYYHLSIESVRTMNENKHRLSALRPLNLPAAQVKLRHSPKGEEIYDPLRKKWIMLTPEEWVRQNFTAWLNTQFGYPAGLMANEISLNLNGTSKRCDTLVYDRQARPIMIVEYKAPDIPITQKVFEQIARYNIVLNVKYLIVSNGMHHYCCMVDREANRYSFLKNIPDYQSLT